MKNMYAKCIVVAATLCAVFAVRPPTVQAQSNSGVEKKEAEVNNGVANDETDLDDSLSFDKRARLSDPSWALPGFGKRLMRLDKNRKQGMVDPSWLAGFGKRAYKSKSDPTWMVGAFGK